MTSDKWVVWSRAARPGEVAKWLAVDVGISEDEARASVARMITAARKYCVDNAEYVALPKGVKP